MKKNLKFKISIFKIRQFIQGTQFTKSTRVVGKVVIITGGNTGIGKETALELASRGATVYLACRDYNRCEAARLDIIAKTGNNNVFNRKLDLSSLKSVRTFVNQFLTEEKRLDILINNAGVFGPKRITEDNFDLTFGVNHLGPFLLTNLLLELLKKSSPSRIIIVSSKLHKIGCIKKDDLNREKSYGVYEAYAQSKLANLLFARTLSNKLNGTGVTVNSLHPGYVATEITRSEPTFLRYIYDFVNKFLAKTPKSGAQTTIKLAVDPDLEKITGNYFSDCKETMMFDSVNDDELAAWLWIYSEENTSLNILKKNN